jgi:hypothetical protein
MRKHSALYQGTTLVAIKGLKDCGLYSLRENSTYKVSPEGTG